MRFHEFLCVSTQVLIQKAAPGFSLHDLQTPASARRLCTLYNKWFDHHV
jgi:hypothetical protein